MRLMIQLCAIVLISAGSFFASRHVVMNRHDRKLALAGKVTRKTLEAQLSNELVDLRNQKKENVAEWDKKLETESANYERVKARLQKHRRLYNESGEFQIPLKALSMVKGGVGLELSQAPDGQIYKPNSTIVNVLSLTSDEIGKMQKLLSTTWQELTTIESKYITVTQDDDMLTVHVDPYFDEGQEVRERFYSRLQNVIGEDRLEVFNILCSDDSAVSEPLLLFGRRQYRFKFTNWGTCKAPEYLREDGTWIRFGCYREMERFIKYKPEYFKNFKP